jgi:pimeloyl-ACP methyl ester carboxylesterase
MMVIATHTTAAQTRSYLVAAIETSTDPLHARHARGRTPANSARRLCIGRRLLTAAVLALSCYTSAAAQSGAASSDAATRPYGPKQVGPWTVSGFISNAGPQCSAERRVPGGAGRGMALQFGLILSRYSSWIGIGAEDWELKPDAAFPVELIAPPILRGESKALARSRQVAWIEVGPYRPLLDHLAKWPAIEVKTAQATFKLPLDVSDRALTELDTCLNALERPPEVAEERTVLTVPGNTGFYRLEALIVRPHKAEGRLPIALITHGRSGNPEKNTAADSRGVRADLMLPQARDLALRGWLVVAVVRRGYGRSDGLPGVSGGIPYMSCEEGDLARALDMEADDLYAALKAIAARPDADSSRAIAIGDSLGGSVALALAARQPAGLRGIVNVSGGVRRAEGDNVCADDRLVAAMANLGARTRIATLWLYAENDSLFPPATVQRMQEAYVKAGGRAELRMLPRIVYDGHNLFSDFKGRGYWLRAFDDFLRAQALPNANDERVDGLMRAAKLPASVRPAVESYFSIPMPRILVVSPSRAVYWIHENSIDGARKRILADCRAKTGAACSVLMENNNLVPSAATGANP